MKLKLYHKLLALLLLTSVVPLMVVSVLLISVGRDQVETTVQQVHRLEADAASARIQQFLQSARERLTADLEGSIDTMLDEEIQSALVWMLGKQDNMITFRILHVHDAQGRQVGAPIRLPPESIPTEHQEFYLVQDEDLARFGRELPLVEALRTGEVQLSRVYVDPRRREGLVAMAVPIVDKAHRTKWVVSGEVSLREVQRMVSDITIGTVGHAYVVDAQGRAVAHPQFDLVRDRETLTGNGIVEVALRSREGTAASFKSPDGSQWLGAHAPLYWGGWHVIVQQPVEDAYRPVHDMKVRALYILLVALAASLACGYLYVRTLVGPLRDVMAGMRRIVDGHFDQRLAVRTGDEVGELASAFNVMGRMLHDYSREIEGWNRELQARVEAKTKALESAQAQLIQSSKLSALGQLGAGVAHELNNPLAGVVGQAALLKRRIRKLEIEPEERARLEGYVQHVENESSRCREIIHGLLAFSQLQASGSGEIDLNESIQRLLLLIQSNVRAAGVTVKHELQPGLPLVEANEQQVQQVLMHVLSNAQQAMQGGGTVTVKTARRGDDEVVIQVTDTGRGIPKEHLDKIFDPFFTTKDVWQNTGLGLSVCYSIVESHGGHIEVESEVGQGSTFTIVLPRRGASRAAAKPASAEEPVGLRRPRLAGASR